MVHDHRHGAQSPAWCTITGTITGTVHDHRHGARSPAWCTITGMVHDHRHGARSPAWCMVTSTMTGMVHDHRHGARSPAWCTITGTMTGMVHGHRHGARSPAWCTITGTITGMVHGHRHGARGLPSPSCWPDSQSIFFSLATFNPHRCSILQMHVACRPCLCNRRPMLGSLSWPESCSAHILPHRSRIHTVWTENRLMLTTWVYAAGFAIDSGCTTFVKRFRDGPNKVGEIPC